MQLVGSVQRTNDLDVHVALLHAPSYQKQMDEKFYDQHKTVAKTAREYVDLFGIMQKIPNALDFLIEDAKNHMQTWGSKDPNFLLCNGALTAQLTMLPELTNYVTNGEQGRARLAAGPDLASYRGLKIINTRKFSMESGTAPRDLLRRRVRVAEYYRIPWDPKNVRRSYEFYDQSRDTMFRLSWRELVEMSKMSGGSDEGDGWSYDNDFWTTGPQWPEESEPFNLDGAALVPPFAHTAKYTIYRRGVDGNVRQEPFEIHEGTGKKNVLKMPQRLVSKKYELVQSTTANDLKLDAPDFRTNSVVTLRNSASYARCRQLHIYSEVYGGGIFSDQKNIDTVANNNGMWQFLNWNQLHRDSRHEAPEPARSLDYVNTKQYFENLCASVPMIAKLEQYAAGKKTNYSVFTWNNEGQMQGGELVTATFNTFEEWLLEIDDNFTKNNYSQYLVRVSKSGLPQLARGEGAALNNDENMVVLSNALVNNSKRNSGRFSALWALKLYVNAIRSLIMDCKDYGTNVQAALKGCNFESVKFSIKAACLQQAKNQFVYNDDVTIAEAQQPDWMAMIGPLMLANVDNEKKNLMLPDLNPHYDHGVNYILQPNMHLDRTTAVKAEDVQCSATSVRPCSWMLQSMLANTYLSEETCKVLLANNPQNGGVDNVNEFQRFLLGGMDVDAANLNWVWTTNLMRWFMSCMHPTQAVRDNETRNQLVMMNYDQKRKLVLAIADAMVNNTKMNQGVENELRNMFTVTDVNESCRFSTDIASNTFGAYQRERQESLNIKDIDIEHIPSELQDSQNGLFHVGKFLFRGRGKRDCLRYCSVNDVNECVSKPWYDASVEPHVLDAQYWVRDPANTEEVLQHFVLILMKRFFKPSSKFMWNGTGMPVVTASAKRFYGFTQDRLLPDGALSTMPQVNDYSLIGEHLLHGPHVATHEAEVSVPGGAQDLLIMRPNIEHEMLGIIMGRGGDGELGATFWGQV